ncbi:MAG TPA: WGxxGxxG family protein [Casimicrobiaceae bacterium]|nr:WGxxGxxG family protein [Casimicrobiaceae bacterium]
MINTSRITLPAAIVCLSVAFGSAIAQTPSQQTPTTAGTTTATAETRRDDRHDRNWSWIGLLGLAGLGGLMRRKEEPRPTCKTSTQGRHRANLSVSPERAAGWRPFLMATCHQTPRYGRCQ